MSCLHHHLCVTLKYSLIHLHMNDSMQCIFQGQCFSLCDRINSKISCYFYTNKPFVVISKAPPFICCSLLIIKVVVFHPPFTWWLSCLLMLILVFIHGMVIFFLYKSVLPAMKGLRAQLSFITLLIVPYPIVFIVPK